MITSPTLGPAQEPAERADGEEAFLRSDISTLSPESACEASTTGGPIRKRVALSSLESWSGYSHDGSLTSQICTLDEPIPRTHLANRSISHPRDFDVDENATIEDGACIQTFAPGVPSELGETLSRAPGGPVYPSISGERSRFSFFNWAERQKVCPVSGQDWLVMIFHFIHSFIFPFSFLYPDYLSDQSKGSLHHQQKQKY